MNWLKIKKKNSFKKKGHANVWHQKPFSPWQNSDTLATEMTLKKKKKNP